MEIGFRIDHDTLQHVTLLQDMDPYFTTLIVSLETEPKRHLHGFGTYTGPSNTGKNWAVPFKKIIKELYQVHGPQFSTSRRKSDSAESYTLKDGDYVYKGYTPEQIQKWHQASFTKPSSYKQKKQKLAKDYVSKKINEDQIMTSLIQLMCEYEVEYYEHKLLAYMRTLNFKRYPSSIADTVFDLKLKLK